jgi:DNA polymerase
MLGLGPRWSRYPPDVTRVDASISTTGDASPGAADHAETLTQSVLVDAMASGLEYGFFHWAARPTFEQPGVDPTQSADCWMMLASPAGEWLERDDLPVQAQVSALLESMLSAIGASVASKPCAGSRDGSVAQEAIERHHMRGILVLGSFAAQAVFGRPYSLESLRGTLHRLTLGASTVPLIVTYSVEHLIDHPADKAGAWRDLNFARSARTQGVCFPISETESNLA